MKLINYFRQELLQLRVRLILWWHIRQLNRAGKQLADYLDKIRYERYKKEYENLTRRRLAQPPTEGHVP